MPISCIVRYGEEDEAGLSGDIKKSANGLFSLYELFFLHIIFH